jgi:dolichol-phosphate mannosyltransferase
MHEPVAQQASPGARGQGATISVLAPCFNEEEALPVLYRVLTETFAGLAGLSLQLVFVDDGSTDRTGAILAQLAASDPRMRVITLSRNFGHQAALSTGLRYATGDAVIICDADLQDSPEIMPAMIERWREGADVVYAVRKNRDAGVLMRFAYHAFYRVLNVASEIGIPTDSGDFGLMDRKVVDAINALPERNRFVRGLRAWVGYRQEALAYDRPARRLGKTKYSFARLTRLAVDGIFDFSTKPLTIIFVFGLVVSAASLAGFLFFLAHRIIGFKVFGHSPEEVPGITSVVLALFFFGGVQLLAIGVLGEYIGRIYREVKRRPIAVVKEANVGEPVAENAESDQP